MFGRFVAGGATVTRSAGSTGFHFPPVGPVRCDGLVVVGQVSWARAATLARGFPAVAPTPRFWRRSGIGGEVTYSAASGGCQNTVEATDATVRPVDVVSIGTRWCRRSPRGGTARLLGRYFALCLPTVYPRSSSSYMPSTSPAKLSTTIAPRLCCGPNQSEAAALHHFTAGASAEDPTTARLRIQGPLRLCVADRPG